MVLELAPPGSMAMAPTYMANCGSSPTSAMNVVTAAAGGGDVDDARVVGVGDDAGDAAGHGEVACVLAVVDRRGANREPLHRHHGRRGIAGAVDQERLAGHGDAALKLQRCPIGDD